MDEEFGLTDLLHILVNLPWASNRKELVMQYVNAAKKAGHIPSPEGLSTYLLELIHRYKPPVGAGPATAFSNEENPLIKPYLKEAWELLHKGVDLFGGCNKPETCASFCNPIEGHWDKRLYDLSLKQRGIFGMVHRCLLEYKDAINGDRT